MVEPGDTVAVHTVVRVLGDDGARHVVETTDVDVALAAGPYDAHEDYEPLAFEVGADEVLPGIDEAVREMEPGESKTVELDPEEAFGSHREDRVVAVSRDSLEEASDTTAEVGAIVRDDRGRVGWIEAVGDDEVTVDFNHELADERLEVEIRLLAVESEDADGDTE